MPLDPIFKRDLLEVETLYRECFQIIKDSWR